MPKELQNVVTKVDDLTWCAQKYGHVSVSEAQGWLCSGAHGRGSCYVMNILLHF